MASGFRLARTGYGANLAMLSEDLFAFPASSIRHVWVLRAFVGVRWIYGGEASNRE